MEVKMPRQYPRGQTQGDVIIINVDSINPQRGPSWKMILTMRRGLFRDFDATWLKQVL